MREIWERFVGWVRRSVTLPNDSESIRIRKTTIAIIHLIIIPVNNGWTVALISMGLELPAWINMVHSSLIFKFARPA